MYIWGENGRSTSRLTASAFSPFAGWGIGVIGMMTLVVAVVGCRMGVLVVDWAWSGDDGGCVGIWCVSAYEIRRLVCVVCGVSVFGCV